MTARRLLPPLAGLALLLGCIRMQPEPPAAPDGAACTVDVDCDSASECYQGVCWARGGCRPDTAGGPPCDEASVCNYGTCLPRECEPGAAATSCGAYRCTDWRCETQCQDDAGCSAGYICRLGACVSARCTAETAASVCLGAACDVSTGQCFDAFDCDTVGCATGYVCDAYSCKKPCSDDSPCAPYKCNYDRCATSCYGTCQSGYRCAGQMCVPDAL